MCELDIQIANSGTNGLSGRTEFVRSSRGTRFDCLAGAARYRATAARIVGRLPKDVAAAAGA